MRPRERTTPTPPPARFTHPPARRLLAALTATLLAAALTATAGGGSPAQAAAGDNPFGPWQWRNQLPQGNTLAAVHFTDPDTGTAVGYNGTILRTTNGGATWAQQPNPITDANDAHLVSDVHFFDTDTGVAVITKDSESVTQDISILRTTDGGTTWTTVPAPDTTQHLSAVSFADQNAGFAVGNNTPGNTCKVLRTTDGGQTWQDKTPGGGDCPGPAGPGTGYRLSGVFAFSPQIVVAVGDNGTIIRSDDGGDSWTVLANFGVTPLPGAAQATFNDVFFTSPDEGWVVGTSGRIFHTTDGGHTWTPQASGAGASDLRAVTFLDDTTGWVVVSDGRMLHTTNGGASWQPQSVLQGGVLNAISFPQPDVGVVVGANGAILRTGDGGDSWTRQFSSVTQAAPNGVDFALNGVDFAAADPDTGMAVGAGGTLLRTEDAGDSWTPLDAPEAGDDFAGVAMIGPDTAVVAGSSANGSGVILRTDDGGQNWQRQQWGTDGLRDVACADSMTCMVVGNLGAVARTEDGGQTWEDRSPPGDIFLPLFNNLTSISCPGVEVCVAVAWRGQIIRTEDGGATWQAQRTADTTDPNLHDVLFVNADTGWVVSAGGLLRTVDGGDSWGEVGLPQPKPRFTKYLSISFAGDGATGAVVGANGQVFRTQDGGVTWVAEQRRNYEDWLLAVVQLDGDTAVAVGEGGTILKRVGDGGSGVPPSRASQDIIATVPQAPGEGSLIVSVDPDDRTVVLPEMQLAGTGDRLATSGQLRPVTVTDTRTTADPGWDVSAQVSDFGGDAGSFGGGFLGWTPQVASQSEGQQVAAGGPVVPGFPTGDGLSVPQTLATAPADGGVGVAQLGAGLALQVPVDTPAGAYTAVLTLTAI